MLSSCEISGTREDASVLRERVAALSERIVALAEAANIVAEAAAPFRAVAAADVNEDSVFAAFAGHDGVKALDRAAAKLEAARLAAVDEFVAVRRQLDGDVEFIQH